MIRVAPASGLLLLSMLHCSDPGGGATPAAAPDAGAGASPARSGADMRRALADAGAGAARPGAATSGMAAPHAEAPAAGVPAARCSAARLAAQPLPPQPGLPAPVEATRQAIAAAARRCDYAALAALGRGPDFKFSLGPDADPVAYWRAQEEEGTAPLARWVRVLALPSAVQDGQHVWPSAAADTAAPEDWRRLEGLYTPAQLAEMQELGGYMGTRLAIRDDGAWTLVLDGD